jgi:PKD repeat protein
MRASVEAKFKNGIYLKPDDCNCGSAPTADFAYGNINTCNGNYGEVQFIYTGSGHPFEFIWEFEEGTPATSDLSNPIVSFTTPGSHKVSLRVRNAYNYAYGIPPYVSKTLTVNVDIGIKEIPYVENFSSIIFPPNEWSISTTDPNTDWDVSGTKRWARRSGYVGEDMLNYSYAYAGINLFKYYAKGIKGHVDDLTTGLISLKESVNPKLMFNLSHQPHYTSPYDILKVEVSTDCGATYQGVYGINGQGKSGDELATVTAQWPPHSFEPKPSLAEVFTHIKSDEWRAEHIDLSPFAGKNIKIRFQTINQNGNNLFIDDVNIAEGVEARLNVSVSSVCDDDQTPVYVSFYVSSLKNEGATPSFQWLIDGVDQKTNQPFGNALLTSGEHIIQCFVKSSLPDILPSFAYSENGKDKIKLYVNQSISIVPPVILANTSTPNVPVTFTAVPSIQTVSLDYYFAWKMDGQLIKNKFGNYTTGNVLTFQNGLPYGTTISVQQFPTNLECYISEVVESNAITMGYYKIDPDIFSRVTTTETKPDEKLDENLKIHPNPVHDILHLSFGNETSNSNFVIIDVVGKRLLEGKCKEQIDVSMLTPGVYVLLVKGTTKRQLRFVKD